MPHYEFDEFRARTAYMATGCTHDAREIYNLVPATWKYPAAIEYLDLRRGDRVTFETLHVETETVFEREFRYGYTGQRVERAVSRTETVTETETLKLWHTKARGYYWIA